MSSDALQPKVIYEPVTKLEAFYTGGAVRVTRDHKHIACACGDEVKFLDVATGTVAKTLPGDSEPITALALSPDCKSLVAASRSLSVRHWDWANGECRRTWKPHRAPVADLAIDASGGYLASGSADRSIKVTDLAGGYVTHHFTGHGGIVLKVLFHPKQLLLFSACDDGEVRIWDLVTKSCAYSLKQGHMSAVPALSLSPDGWHLLSGGRDKVVCVWDIRNGSRVGTIPVFEALEGIAVLPLGSAFPGVAAADAAAALTSSSKQGSAAAKPLFFATAGERGVLRIWRSDTGTCVYTHHGSSSSLLQQQGRSKGSKASKKGAGAAGDDGSGAAAAAGSEFVELLLLPGGKGLMAATGDARLLFYYPEAPSGAAAAASLRLTRQLIGNHDEITDLCFLYTASSSSSSNEPQAAAAPAAAATAAGDASAPQGLVLGPGEPRRLAVATNSHDIRLFDLSDASCVGGCVGHRDIVLCLDTVRPAAGVELLASGSKDCEVRVWDPATTTCLAVAAGHVAAVTAIAWSGSKSKAGKYLASGGADKLLKLWDTSKLVAAAAAAAAVGEAAAPAAQQSLSTIAAVAAHDKDVNAIAFSPNDALLATASQDRTIKLWKLPSLVLSQTLRGHKRGVWDVSFSPVDQVLLSCSADKLVKMWSVGEGTCLRTFEGHTGGVLRCMFMTAGTQVMSAGADGLLKLWDARAGVNTSTFEGHEDRLWGLTASAGPAEALVASGGGDARVVLWRDATAAKAAEAEAQEEGLVVQQQELSNALADGDYASAARLAFRLRHPGRLLEVLRRQPGGPAAALGALQGLVGQLDAAELATALSYCREWNTNTRNAHLAQVLLAAVLRSHTPEQILEVAGSRELLDGLLAYSQRHAARLDRLMRATFLLDYTLAASQVLLPADMTQEGPAGSGSDAAAAGDELGNGDDEEQGQQGGRGKDAGAAAGGGGGAEVPAAGFGAGVLKMNGRAGDDSDSSFEASLGGEEGGEDEEQQGDGAGGSSSSSEMEERSEEEEAAAAAAVDDDDDDDGDNDGVQLPGWGGGDDLDDGWAGMPSSSGEGEGEDGEGEEAAAASGSDMDADGSSEGGEGSSSSSEESSEGGEGESQEEEEDEQQPAVAAEGGWRQKAAAGSKQQKGSVVEQQQQQLLQRRQLKQPRGSSKSQAAPAAAAAAAAAGTKRKPAAVAVQEAPAAAGVSPKQRKLRPRWA